MSEEIERLELQSQTDGSVSAAAPMTSDGELALFALRLWLNHVRLKESVSRDAFPDPPLTPWERVAAEAVVLRSVSPSAACPLYRAILGTRCCFDADGDLLEGASMDDAMAAVIAPSAMVETVSELFGNSGIRRFTEAQRREADLLCVVAIALICDEQHSPASQTASQCLKTISTMSGISERLVALGRSLLRGTLLAGRDDPMILETLYDVIDFKPGEVASSKDFKPTNDEVAQILIQRYYYRDPNWTQERIAEVAGLSRQTLNKKFGEMMRRIKAQGKSGPSGSLVPSADI